MIFAKCDLTLNGIGSLTVKDTTGHGIVSKDDLVVTGGTYTIDSQDHCLNGKDSVRIAEGLLIITGGTININADGDGIDSNGGIGITGGSVYVLGPSDNGNGAMDYGICAAITGGEIIAVGGSGGMQRPGGNSDEGNMQRPDGDSDNGQNDSTNGS